MKFVTSLYFLSAIRVSLTNSLKILFNNIFIGGFFSLEVISISIKKYYAEYITEVLSYFYTLIRSAFSAGGFKFRTQIQLDLHLMDFCALYAHTEKLSDAKMNLAKKLNWLHSIYILC